MERGRPLAVRRAVVRGQLPATGPQRQHRLFLPDDPPGREQLAALPRHVNATLREVADRLLWEGVPERAIGTSKTFKQLARLVGAPAQRKGPFVRRFVTARDLRHGFRGSPRSVLQSGQSYRAFHGPVAGRSSPGRWSPGPA